MEERLGFLETMVLVSPPNLGVPGHSNDGHVTGLGVTTSSSKGVDPRSHKILGRVGEGAH